MAGADGFYGIYSMVGTGVLMYNKDIFDDAGIPYPDSTWDYDKLLEVAKELRLMKTAMEPPISGESCRGAAIGFIVSYHPSEGPSSTRIFPNRISSLRGHWPVCSTIVT